METRLVCFIRLKYLVMAAVLAGGANTVQAADYKAGNLVVHDPWSRAMVPAAKVGSGYLEIRNYGDVADRLVEVRSPVSVRVEIHEMRMNADVMKMRKLPDGLEIQPHAAITLEPGGYHLMFFSPHASFKEGESFKASLVFEKAGVVDVAFSIKAMDNGKAGHGGH